LQGLTKTSEIPFDDGVETFGLTLRAGFAYHDLELSFVYHLNSVSTWRFLRTGHEEQYGWNSIGLRLGWAVPLTAPVSTMPKTSSN